MSAVEVEADSADAALEQVLAGGHPHAVEVWRGAELLARGRGGSLGPDAEAAASAFTLPGSEAPGRPPGRRC
ncbi:MAG: hypothetical protein JWQ97_1897 [Phenylobacterium sp.]|nr:hypothetical protein [Phenylobacterium sp.]